MKLFTTALAAAVLFSLSGCEIRGPSIRIKPPVEIVVDGKDGKGAKHCPPGQAKKGNC